MYFFLIYVKNYSIIKSLQSSTKEKGKPGVLLINSSSSSKEITKSNVKAHVGMISMLDSKTNLTDNSFYLINGAEEGFAYYYNNGVMLKSKVTLSRSIKPVIAIKNSILKSGKGTSEDPYVMEG